MTPEDIAVLLLPVRIFAIVFFVISLIVFAMTINAIIRTPKEIRKNRAVLTRILTAIQLRNP